MKFLFTLILTLACLCSRASTVIVSLTNFDGTTSTNAIRITPGLPQVDGSFIVTGTATRYPAQGPLIGGVTNLTLLQATYQLEVVSPDNGWTTLEYFTVPNDNLTHNVIDLLTVPASNVPQSYTTTASDANYARATNILAGANITVTPGSDVAGFPTVTIASTGGSTVPTNLFLLTSGGTGTNETFHGTTSADTLIATLYDGGQMFLSQLSAFTFPFIGFNNANTGTNDFLSFTNNGVKVASLSYQGKWFGDGSLLSGVQPLATFLTHLAAGNASDILGTTATTALAGNTAFQPLSALLTAWANYSTNGFIGSLLGSGTNTILTTPHFYLQDTSNFWIGDSSNNMIASFTYSGQAHKWYFEVGGGASPNGLVKDIHFGLEANYFLQVLEQGSTVYSQQTGDAVIKTNVQGEIVKYPEWKMFDTSGSSLASVWRLWTMDGTFRPAHIETQMEVLNEGLDASLDPAYPQAAAGPAAGTTGSVSVIMGNDSIQQVTVLVAGTVSASGNLFTNYFAQKFEEPPTVTLTANNPTAQLFNSAYVLSTSTTNYVVAASAITTPGATLKYHVHVLAGTGNFGP